MKIIWSPLAIDRITEIARFIALENPSAANELVTNIFYHVDQLESFPESGPMVPELNRKEIRQLIEGNFKIVYRISKKEISILTIRHNRQLFTENDLE